MNLYYLSLSNIPSRAANSVHVMKMCSAFAGLGYSVTLFCRKGSPAADNPHAFYAVENDNFHLQTVPFYPLRILGTLLFTFAVFCHLAFRKLQGKDGICYGRDPFSLCCAAWLGFPVAIELHMPPLRGTWKFCLRQICASRRFLGIVCISQGLACEVRSLLGKDISILVAHDGADAQRTPSEQSPPEKERAEHLNVGYVGSLYEGRGIDFIFQLAAALPAMSFFLVGGSPEEIARWQKKSPENVHFRGFVPQYDLPDTYANFDVMLAPYAGHVAVAGDHKGGNSNSTAGYMSPLKIFEYMSYGKPFIASAMPAIEEITGPDATCCLLRPYGDINAWRDALTQLSEDPALRQRLAEASCFKFLHEYTWTKRAENISQLWCAC